MLHHTVVWLVSMVAALASGVGQVSSTASANAPATLDNAEAAFERARKSPRQGQLWRDDCRTARQIFLDQANRGVPRAQVRFAQFLTSGVCEPQNYAEAAKWFHLAANQNTDTRAQVFAQAGLCMHYRSDHRGTTIVNFQAALNWCRKVVQNGNASGSDIFLRQVACGTLGDLYKNGNGVTKDNIRALMWYYLASRDIDRLDISNLESEMTPSQIAAARALATRCQESGYRNCE